MGDPILDAGYLRLEIDPPVAVLTLDRPEALNAQTPATWVALNHAHDLLPPEVRVVIVTGAGRAFSAGLDRAAWTDGSLHSIADLPNSLALDQIERYQRAFVRLAEPDRITIAAVRGPAVGAGFQLALACHLIVAADDAVFSLYEVALGLVPDLGGIGRLARSVGERRTLELAATGRQLGAAEAASLGTGDPGGAGGPTGCCRAGVGGRPGGEPGACRAGGDRVGGRRRRSRAARAADGRAQRAAAVAAGAQPRLIGLGAQAACPGRCDLPRLQPGHPSIAWALVASSQPGNARSSNRSRSTLGGRTPSEWAPANRVAQNASPTAAGACRNSRLACSSTASCSARRRALLGSTSASPSSRSVRGVEPGVGAAGERDLGEQRGRPPARRATRTRSTSSAMHVAGALPDRVQRRLAEQPRHPGVLDVAVAAEAFQRLGDDGRRPLADPELRRRNGQPQERRLAGVDRVRPAAARARWRPPTSSARSASTWRITGASRQPACRTPTGAGRGAPPAPAPPADRRPSRARSPAGSSSPSRRIVAHARGPVRRSASRRCPSNSTSDDAFDRLPSLSFSRCSRNVLRSPPGSTRGTRKQVGPVVEPAPAPGTGRSSAPSRTTCAR